MFQILYKSYLSSSALPGVKPFDGWPTSVLAYFISPQKYHGACLFYLKFNCFWGVLCFKLQQLIRVTMAASSSLLNQTELVNHSHRTAVGPDTTWETITLSVTPLIDGHMDQGFHAPWIITVQLHTLGALVIIIYVQGQVELSIFVNLANRDARFWVQSRAFSTTRLQRTWLIWWQNADYPVYNQIKTSPSCGTAGATQFGERDRAAERQILISRCPCISLIKIWYEHASIPLNQGCETHFCHRRQFTVTLEGPLWLWNTCLITCLYYYIYCTQLID